MSWITHCSLHPTYNSECGVCIAWALFASAGAPTEETDHG
jgi:hypothetical protein